MKSLCQNTMELANASEAYDFRRKRRRSSISTEASESLIPKRRRPSATTNYSLTDEERGALPPGIYFHNTNQVSRFMAELV